MKKDGIPSLKRGLKVLRLLADGQERGLSEIARQLGISKSTLHAILLTLEGEGFLIRDERTKKYALGPALFELLSRGLSELQLRKVAAEPLQRLHRFARETVFLGVVRGERVIVLEVLESEEDLKVTSRIGARVPLYAGALGKAYLARFDDDKVRAILEAKGLRAYTPKTITDPKAYMEELRRVRERGVAVDDEEYLEGVRAVATFVDVPPLPPIALWIVGFSSTFTYERIAQVIPVLKETAEAISSALRNGPRG